MKIYESFLFNGHCVNESTGKIKSVLGIGIGIGNEEQRLTSWRPSNKLAAVDCTRICSVIGAYRLLDVVAMLDGFQPARRVERMYMSVSNTTFRVSSNTQDSISPLTSLGNGKNGQLAAGIARIQKNG
jgi:hypothetical protein